MANRTLKLVIGEKKIGASKMFRQKKKKNLTVHVALYGT